MPSRITVHVDESFLQARDIEQVLAAAGVDVKLVTKHAVQIHPDHKDKAITALAGKVFLRCVGGEAGDPGEEAPDAPVTAKRPRRDMEI